MDTATCGSCGKAYAPHPAYRNKAQACDGPNGYCAGVIDGREDVADELRAAVERCAELASEVKAQWCMRNTQYLEAEDDRAKCEAWEERASKAEAALAKVTAERDAGRERLLCACTYVDLEHNENERDIARLLAVPRYELPALLADALNVNWICRERATPTDGETE